MEILGKSHHHVERLNGRRVVRITRPEGIMVYPMNRNLLPNRTGYGRAQWEDSYETGAAASAQVCQWRTAQWIAYETGTVSHRGCQWPHQAQWRVP